MKPSVNTSDSFIYETRELKLAALFLAEISELSFEVYENPNLVRKTIKITSPKNHKDTIAKLERDFINKEAVTNVYAYNKALNLIRDRLRESNEGKKIFPRR